MNKKEFIFSATVSALALVILGISLFKPAGGTLQGGGVIQPVIYGAGMTQASTTVNTTSTQVLPNTWQTWARITNPGTSTISCYADGQTAASSTVNANAGVLVQSNLLPGNSLTFGVTVNADVPYVGSVNCVANVQQKVAAAYK